jgi:hypothetical protein
MNTKFGERSLRWLRVPNLIRGGRGDVIPPALLLAVFLTISLLSVLHKTMTYDEADHYRYGKQILELNSDRFDDSKMPVSALNAAPAKLAENLPQGTLRFILSKFVTARAVTALVACLLGGLLYVWTKQMYGRLASTATLLMFAFEPSIIAHSTLVTTDLYAAFSGALTVYALWVYLKKRHALNALFLGLALGFGLIAKYTNVLLLPVILVLFGLHWMGSRTSRKAVVCSRRTHGWARSPYTHAAITLVACLTVVNIGFLFNRTFMPLREYSFRSPPPTWLQENAPLIAQIPVPVPYPYLEGLDWVYHLERTNFEGRGKYYLFGELRNEPFPAYYSVAFLFKVPLAIQILFIGAAVRFLRRWNVESFFEKDVYVLAPLSIYSIYFNFLNNSQLGLRYFLVAFPFYLIFAGRFVEAWDSWSASQRLSCLALALWLIISVMSYFPHYIPYFNELVLDRTTAYMVLADSNIDWGQSGHYLDEYRMLNPTAKISPDRPTSGLIAVRVNDLVGITASPARYEWLRRCCQPIDTVGYSILVYQVSSSQITPGP